MSSPGWLPRAWRAYTVAAFVALSCLDNVAIGLVPPLLSPISVGLGVSEAAVGVVAAVSFLVTAVASVGWAYAGDRLDRRRLLVVGTLVWSGGAAATASADSLPWFVVAQLLTAVGLGAVGSVGFSVVSDLVPPRRRGLALAFWGLGQGVGTLTGTLLSGLLGARDWSRPFLALAVAGVVAAAAYGLSAPVPRGGSEPELAALFAAGGSYEQRIGPRDLPSILGRRTNVWLIAQGLTAQAALGSMVWLPRLFQARAQEQGYDEPTAIVIGSVFATAFQLGGALSLVGGAIGDRLGRRDPAARLRVAAIGVLGAVPLYLFVLFLPMRVTVVPGSATAVAGQVLASLVTEPTAALTWGLAVLAVGLTSANSPNWFASIVEVNPPEHRGTVYSLGNLVNGVGRSAGAAVVAALTRGLAGVAPGPLGIAAALAVCQLLFVPTGWMYLRAARSCRADAWSVRTMLRDRARRAMPPAASPDPGVLGGGRSHGGGERDLP
ncbi:MFS transporter [Pilimelia columellifera]|uniref:Major facilitator superfamily (MFS) profile domain-containing protein n=1 Tax=Pilimelia columellifera subsp. columellifera TaxID=706583 RepID=A0ABN3NPW4_9ACTN